MPTIICSYCQYVGQCPSEYRDLEGEIADVDKHEKTCSEKPKEEDK